MKVDEKGAIIAVLNLICSIGNFYHGNRLLGLLNVIVAIVIITLLSLTNKK
jgi:hypothetical protein